MIRWNILRRLAVAEALLQAREGPAGKGLAALLASLRRNPPDAEASMPTGPLRGLELVLAEARTLLQKGDTDGRSDPDDDL